MLDLGGLHLVFAHVLALVVVFGGSLFMIFVLSPVAQDLLPQEQYYKLIGRVIRKFHPIALGCYGVLIMTGAWMITRYKIDSGVNYFQEYGEILGIKLLLVFVSIMVACYQFFGLGTGIVAMVEGEAEAASLPEKLRKLRLASIVNAIILLAVVYVGLAMSRA